MKKDMLVTLDHEPIAVAIVIRDLMEKYPAMNASNTVVLMVSPDYSATAAMHIAHALSHAGEMCDIIPIDVPYPDEEVSIYRSKAEDTIELHQNYHPRHYEYWLLVEAGVIRGGNYKWLTQLIKQRVESKIVTCALFENTHSAFKSDVVAHYYDNETEDLTFYYERYNKHWNT